MILIMGKLKVDGTNGEYSHGNKKKGIDKGWSFICQDEDGEVQGWNVTEILIGLVCDNPQAAGIEIVQREQVQVVGGFSPHN